MNEKMQWEEPNSTIWSAFVVRNVMHSSNCTGCFQFHVVHPQKDTRFCKSLNWVSIAHHSVFSRPPSLDSFHSSWKRHSPLKSRRRLNSGCCYAHIFRLLRLRRVHASDIQISLDQADQPSPYLSKQNNPHPHPHPHPRFLGRKSSTSTIDLLVVAKLGRGRIPVLNRNQWFPRLIDSRLIY